jgi:hypothetical protein
MRRIRDSWFAGHMPSIFKRRAREGSAPGGKVPSSRFLKELFPRFLLTMLCQAVFTIFYYIRLFGTAPTILKNRLEKKYFFL